MEGPRLPAFPTPEPADQARWWRDVPALACLLALSLGIHLWLISHTAVTARDGVGFIRYAWQLREPGQWAEVMRQNPHPPGYPLAVLLLSVPVRAWATGDNAAVMQLSAQLTSALAGMLLVVPMFYVAKKFFGRGVGFWSAALFQCFPVGSRAMADALSESLFLLFLALALWCAVEALGRRSLLPCALTGLLGGLAYLVRPEGLLVVIATGMVTTAAQLAAGWRRPAKEVLRFGVCLAVPAAAVSVPYMWTIGHFTNKHTGQVLIENAEYQRSWNKGDKGMVAGPDALRCAERSPAAAAVLPLAVWNYEEVRSQSQQLAFSFQALMTEVMRGYYYVALVPAFLGFYWFGDRLRAGPAAWVPLVFAFLHLLVLWRVAYLAGYLAERHTLVIVMCTLPWAVADVFAWGEFFVAVGNKLAPRLRTTCWAVLPRWLPFLNTPQGIATVLLVALSLSALPKTLEPMHLNRAGHRAAGDWLACNARPSDVIVDPFSWGEYYAGQVFRDGDPLRKPPSPDRTVYVIIGGTEHEHKRLPMYEDAIKIAQKGVPVFRWPPAPLKYKAEEVVIFSVPSSAVLSR